jgi:hypothetical protein
VPQGANQYPISGDLGKSLRPIVAQPLQADSHSFADAPVLVLRALAHRRQALLIAAGGDSTQRYQANHDHENVSRIMS